jgi:hypothetical protein
MRSLPWPGDALLIVRLKEIHHVGGVTPSENPSMRELGVL